MYKVLLAYLLNAVMSLSSHFGKLWVKIAISTALISWIGIEVIIRITLVDSVENTRKALEHNLSDIAAIAARTLSGDEHQTALAHSDSSHVLFKKLSSQMDSLRTSISFQEHWYTLLPNKGDTTYFGIMTHPTPFSGDIYVFQDTSVRTLFEQVLAQKKSLATGIYKSANGIWLSGFAPILNSKRKAVAVLEVDIRYEDYLARENAIYNRAMWIRVIGFFIGGLLGTLMGYIIAKPLRTVNTAVEQIAHNNFQGSVKIPLLLIYLPDETTQLIINFNQMAAKLEETLRELRMANQRLQTLDHAKTVFLQFIAHELRTPLNGLKLLHILPKLQEFNEDSLEVLQGALESVKRLQHFSLAAEQYIQALTHTPDFSEATDLAEVLPYIIDEYRLVAQEHDISIRYEHTNTPLPACLRYDILEQILHPIFDNAIKFSPKDSTITVKTQQHDEDITIQICDVGKGFSPSIAENIFKPFFVENIEHHSQGTGVSLAIARVLTQHYQGSLVATSLGENRGSTFTLTFFRTRRTLAASQASPEQHTTGTRLSHSAPV